MERRLDDTGFGTIKILQNPEEFCYGVDAVLLASMASSALQQRQDGKCIDLGTGTGIIPLIMSHKTKATYLAGIEIQMNSFNTAVENVSINNLSERLHFFNKDIHSVANQADTDIEYGSFDVVTTNPPYTEGNGGITGKNKTKAIARHETTADLEDFVKCASRLLKDRGHFYMVHRPARLVDICELCRKYKLEPKEMQFVSGKPNEKPNILLVHCVKNGNKELKLLNPLHIHEADEGYSQEVLHIYEKY